MAVVSALVHLFAYAGLTGYFDRPGVGFMLAGIALPVLALHFAIYAGARFSSIGGLLMAVVLNVALAAAGWFWWSARVDRASISHDDAIASAVIFVAIGLATAIALIAWLRLTRPPARTTGS